MSETQSPSTLQRPDEKLISRFGLWQVKDHTIRTYLEKGFSLGICCRNCPRTIEWTPPELLRRFEDRLDLPSRCWCPACPARARRAAGRMTLRFSRISTTGPGAGRRRGKAGTPINRGWSHPGEHRSQRSSRSRPARAVGGVSPPPTARRSSRGRGRLPSSRSPA